MMFRLPWPGPRLAVLAIALTMACLCALAPVANAQSGYTSTRAMSFGGAWSGGPSNGALYVNPAGMMLLSTYSAEFGYHYNGAGNRHGLGVSAIDSSTNPNIAAGVAYSYTLGPGEEDGKNDNARDHDMRFAVAVPVVPNLLFLGVGGHYTSVRGFETVTRAPPIGLPTSPIVTTEATRFNAMTVDIGLMAALARVVAIGVSVQNLAQTENVLEGRRYNGGAAFFIGPVHAEAQYSMAQRRDNKEYEGTFSAGAEVTIARRVPIRVGMTTRSFTDALWITGGLGYRSEYVGFEVGYQQSIEVANDRAAMATVSIYR